jgi:3-methyladenine DNA glycosylase AlkD
MTAAGVQKALKRVATEARAKSNAWFFKTGPGQYGEGDVFIGVTVPESRKIAKQFSDLALLEIERLLYSNIHEERLVALHILTDQYVTAKPAARKRIYQFYLKHRARVNNWDLVDTSASAIVGGYLCEFGDWKKVLPKLAKAKSLWDRRIAIVSTFYFIKKRDYEPTLAIGKILLHDKHDLIQKAVGWMLREMGKMDEKPLYAFLETYAQRMPRTMLRYAIERFPESVRKSYLLRKSQSAL